MVCTGHVDNGVILADGPLDLPEGAVVRFEMALESESRADLSLTFGERFAEVMGKARSFPDVGEIENAQQERWRT